ncbi:NEAT domain-containing protein [Staphylococcus simulans]|uniref:NEAT domain-containing protein n=1 Tax=Staphylococcus simulans TaxID=1286 RepID=UPI00399A39A3
MNVPQKCLVAVLCSSLLCSFTIDESKAEVNQQTLSQQTIKEIPFKVYKENSQDVSVMNDYMAHPATVKTKNNKVYLQFKLLHPEWWKAFELYEGDKQCDVRTVSETKEARIVEVEVTPETQTLTSKVHIIVPDIHYDHHYTTKIDLEAQLPKDVTPNVQPTPKPSPESKPKHDVQPQPGTQPTEKHTPKKVIPKESHSHVSEMQNLNFKVLKHQTNERSVMNQYMVHPAKVTYYNQQATVQMTLNNAAWWKSFEIFNGETRVPVKVISEDTQQDQRIIEFNMPKDQKMLTSKVHIIVPHLNYDHHYTTEIMFNESAIETNTSSQQEEKSGTSIKQNDDTTASTNDSTEINETKASTIVAAPSDNNEQALTNQPFNHAQATKETPFITSSLPTGSVHSSAVKAVQTAKPTEEPPLPEIFPKFNRNADNSEPIKFTKTQSDVGKYLKKMNQIYLGAVIVLASALLVVSTLYVRKGEGHSHEKKH